MFRRRETGLLELVGAALAIWALLATTPLGALVDRASGRPPRSLLSYFAFDRAPPPPAALRALDSSPDAAVAAAMRSGARPELIAALALILGDGRRTAEGVPDVALSPVAARALAAAGVPGELLAGDARQRLEALATGVPRLSRALGSDEAAVAALAVGEPLVRAAVESARREGGSPASLEALTAHLPRSARLAATDLGHGVLALADGLALAWPLPATTRVSSPYGFRLHPLLGIRKLHTGVDLSTPLHTPVQATGAGVVKRAGEDGINGRFLVIDHGHGLTTAYCHADRLLVARGDRVAAGATILLSGSTGRSTGPHLHYQVELGGVPVDPLRLQPPGRRPAALLGPAAGGVGG